MRVLAVAALAAAFSLPASAEETLVDKANEKLSAGQKSVKSGAKKLEDDANTSLEKARKGARKMGRKLEKDANDAAKSLRQKLGTEK